MSYDWDKIAENPYEFAKKSSKEALEKCILEADAFYYNNVSKLNDIHYEILRKFYETTYGSSNNLNKIGAAVNKNKVTLPVYLPSIDKVHGDTNEITKFIAKYSGSFVLTDKLDGMSLYIKVEDNIGKAFTRGNGIIGQDISWILTYLNIDTSHNFQVRGELIISKKNWQILRAIYPKYKNPRNFVSGYTSKKVVDPKIMELIDFIGYEYISSPSLKQSDQLITLKSLGIKVVNYTLIKKELISNEKLSMILQERRNVGTYLIDGIIITDDNSYERIQPPTKFPSYAKAFKNILDSHTAEVVVLKTNWTPSMYGVLKPVIKIAGVVLDDVTINNITGNNAKFILHNNIGGPIGPGSIVKITRSGGVIPKILQVVKPYKGDLKNCLPMDYKYHWNESDVEIILDNYSVNNIVKKKQILHFFSTLGTTYLKEGIVRKLYENGYDSIYKILTISKKDLLKLDGIKERSSDKIYNAIQLYYNKATLVDLMAGTTHFGAGFGKRMLTPILEMFPNILDIDIKDPSIYNETKNKLLLIRGFQLKTVTKFLNGLTHFKTFYQSLPKQVIKKAVTKKIIFKKKVKGDKYKGHVYMCTGFRPKVDFKHKIESNGGIFEDTMKSNVTHLIVKSRESKPTSKMKKAIEKNLTIVYFDELFHT